MIEADCLVASRALSHTEASDIGAPDRAVREQFKGAPAQRGQAALQRLVAATSPARLDTPSAAVCQSVVRAQHHVPVRWHRRQEGLRPRDQPGGQGAAQRQAAQCAGRRRDSITSQERDQAWHGHEKKGIAAQVPPGIEPGALDSKSRVLTATPRDLTTNADFFRIAHT